MPVMAPPRNATCSAGSSPMLAACAVLFGVMLLLYAPFVLLISILLALLALGLVPFLYPGRAGQVALLVLLAATNRPEILDPARLSRQRARLILRKRAALRRGKQQADLLTASLGLRPERMTVEQAHRYGIQGSMSYCTDLGKHLAAVQRVASGTIDYLVVSQDDAKPRGVHLADRAAVSEAASAPVQA